VRGWTDRKGSILTTLEPGTIMVSDVPGLYDASDGGSVQSYQRSVAIEKINHDGDGIAVSLGSRHSLSLSGCQTLLPII